MSLNTIKDFDFGVGGNINIPKRVSDSPTDVSECEVKFIVWLLLKQEFQKAKRVKSGAGWASRTQHDGSQQDEDDDDGDDEIQGTQRLNLTGECFCKAREFAEVALREAGVNVM